jgi:hypothetical protein
VLDPWNGSGTTTRAAQTVGFPSIGIDYNPVASIVAHLKSQDVTGKDVDSFLREPLRENGVEVAEDEPLSLWFDSQSSKRIRAWVNCFSAAPEPFHSLGLVAVFRTVRSLTKGFEGSNPTWVKQSKNEGDSIEIDRHSLDAMISDERSFIVDRLRLAPGRNANTVIVTASCKRMPLSDSCIDLILTSPPYLTRIDYAIAYMRELAVLGINVRADRKMRSELMGTTVIRRGSAVSASSFGELSEKLLMHVAQHGSHASGVYYLKQTRQYLTDLTESLDDITRVAKPGAFMHLVVQDSYYKEIPVPLADICIDESGLRGWKLLKKDPHPVKRTLVALNTVARSYVKGAVEESVISLQKI